VATTSSGRSPAVVPNAATLSFRDEVVDLTELPTLPPWFRDTA